MPFKTKKLFHANGWRSPSLGPIRLSDVQSCHNRKKSFTSPVYGNRYGGSKQVGHKASACPRNHIQKSIEPFPDQGSWSYQDRQRGERERTRYDQSTFPYPDRSRSRDRDDRHRNDDDRRNRDRYSFRSVANSATQTNTTAGDSDWAQLQRDLQR